MDVCPNFALDSCWQCHNSLSSYSLCFNNLPSFYLHSPWWVATTKNSSMTFFSNAVFDTSHWSNITSVRSKGNLWYFKWKMCLNGVGYCSMIFAGLGTVHGFPTLYIDNYAWISNKISYLNFAGNFIGWEFIFCACFLSVNLLIVCDCCVLQAFPELTTSDV